LRASRQFAELVEPFAEGGFAWLPGAERNEQQLCRLLVLLRTYSGREGKRELRRHGAHRRMLDAALCQALLRVVLASLRPAAMREGTAAAASAASASNAGLPPAAMTAGIPAAASLPSRARPTDVRASGLAAGDRWSKASPAPQRHLPHRTRAQQANMAALRPKVSRWR